MKINYWEKFEKDCVYHIYSRSINSEKLFVTEDNYQFFLEKWKKLILPWFKVYAYCLVPNHFHFLVKVRELNEGLLELIKNSPTVKSYLFIEDKITYNEWLEDQFKRLFSSYALAFNKQQMRKGSLFQKRFKRISVGKESQKLHLLAYIHHNPIHHKLCEKYEHWKFSSYHSFLSERKSAVAREDVFSWFNTRNKTGKLDGFLKLHREFKMVKQEEHSYLE